MSDSSFTKGPTLLQAVHRQWQKFVGTAPPEAGVSEGIIGAIPTSSILDGAPDAFAVVKGALTGLNVGSVGDCGLALFTWSEAPRTQPKLSAWQPKAATAESKST